MSLHRPYTDVFLLMVQMYPSLPCYICFHTGKKNVKRNIPVQPVYNKLGHSRASAILSFHARTWWDMSGKPINGSSKCLWHMTMTCFGIFRPPRPIARRNRPVWMIRLPTIHVQSIHQSERLSVFIVLQPHNWRGDPPPTTGSLTMHIQRTHYVLAMIWRKAMESHPRLWLGVWHDQTVLNSSKMFESSSRCSCNELGKVWLQTRMQEGV